MVKIHNLSKMWLKNIVNSRLEYLHDPQFLDINAVESYAEKSNSSIYYLTLQSLGKEFLRFLGRHEVKGYCRYPGVGVRCASFVVCRSQVISHGHSIELKYNLAT